jgi:ABC-type Zn uptake system ZnuABC Zn-binding protein ZnuA
MDAESEHGVDPHLWLDPNNMIVYAENIRDGLIQFDPEGTETYRVNASAYLEQLAQLDTWIREQVAQIEPEPDPCHQPRSFWLFCRTLWI